MALWKIPYTGATFVYADSKEEAIEKFNDDDFLCDVRANEDTVETTEEEMLSGLVEVGEQFSDLVVEE